MVVMSATESESTPGVWPILIPRALAPLTSMWSAARQSCAYHTRAKKPLTKADREGANSLQVGVAGVQELLVDLVAALAVHEADGNDIGVGNVLEDPGAGGLGVDGVDDQVKARGLELGHGCGADVAGTV
jgi:hypothetical protein